MRPKVPLPTRSTDDWAAMVVLMGEEPRSPQKLHAFGSSFHWHGQRLTRRISRRVVEMTMRATQNTPRREFGEVSDELLSVGMRPNARKQLEL